MKIIRTDRKPALARSSPRSTSEFEPKTSPYYGPGDGLSQTPKHQGLYRPVLQGLTKLMYRVEVEGEENLPSSGANIYAANHSSYLDLAIVPSLMRQDTRTMLTIDAFKLRAGAKMAEHMGAFPVNKEAVSPATKQHPVDLLKEKKGFLIFPGATFRDHAANHKVEPFKKGVGYIALEGKADALIPIALDFQPREKTQLLPTTGALLGAAALSASTYAASFGGPLARSIGGAVAGALIGSVALGTVGKKTVQNKRFWNPAPQLGATLVGAGIGGVLGAVGGAYMAQGVASGLSAAGPALGSGIAALSVAHYLQNRDVARVKIGAPISLEAYHRKATPSLAAKKAAAKEMTERLHVEIGQLKANLSGVPYDPSETKIEKGDPVVSTLAQFETLETA